MGSETDSNQEQPSGTERGDKASVRLRTLAIILVSVIIGAALVIVVKNAITPETITLTTMELITFLFSIALATASIVLAVVAITQARDSERAITQRSDESVQIQNDVFTRTIEVLARIETSTGVTERRIEDIVSGRVGAISEGITDTILADKGLEDKTREEIENEIRQSLLEEFTRVAPSRTSEEVKERRQERLASRARYKDFKDALLLEVASLPNVRALRIGEGEFSGSGADLVDGLFEMNGLQFTVSTFSANKAWILNKGRNRGLKSYIRSLLIEIANGVFARSYLAFDRSVDGEVIFAKLLDDTRAIAKDEIVSKILITSGSKDHVSEFIQEHLENNELNRSGT